jgi:ABC-type polysaccharide/polyol phosphate export permease
MRSFSESKINEEIRAIAVYFNMWFLLGIYDIRQRYRRSLIGPLWITISTGIMVGSIGFIFSTIFKSPMSEFLPYFAVGQIIWLFISTQLSEACTTFVHYQSIIKQISVPLSVHIMRRLWNNLILLGHNFFIILAVLIISGRGFSWSILYVVPALLLSLLLLFLISIILSIVCTRFRDITQIVGVFLQLIYFFTPILWMKKVLPGDYEWVSLYNPFYHIIELVRAPLLGDAPAVIHWVFMLLYIVCCSAFAMVLLKRYRHRVAYWL